jgi:hypothetical protein
LFTGQLSGEWLPYIPYNPIEIALLISVIKIIGG